MTGGREDAGSGEDRTASSLSTSHWEKLTHGSPTPALWPAPVCTPGSHGESKLWQMASEHAQKADPDMGTGTLTGFVWENKREAVRICCGALLGRRGGIKA